MADLALSLAITAAACAIGLIVHRIRNDRFPAWAVWMTTAFCAIGWLSMLLTDWPLETLDGFWSRHSVLASTISSMLLVGVVFLVYERSEKHRQSQLEDGISGAGAGGIVDHLVDVEVALALLSAPVSPAEYAPDHWATWDSPNKPLKWLREGRTEMLGTHDASAAAPLDPRRLRVTPDMVPNPWGCELIDQSIRRLLAAMRDWSSLIGSSTKGTLVLLALSQLRTDLMRLHEKYRRASDPEIARNVFELRAQLRVLAIYCEDWSGAPHPRAEVLPDARSLVPTPPGARRMFDNSDRSLRHDLANRADQMGFTGPLCSVDQVRTFVRVAHAGQIDKLGRTYLQHHLEPVAAKLAERGDQAEMAGLLHDVLEDTWVTADDLRGMGIPDEVITAVEAVSRRAGESYDDLIARAAADTLGIWVKLADNEVNLESNAQLAHLDPATADRLRNKYEAARRTLLAAARSHR